MTDIVEGRWHTEEMTPAKYRLELQRLKEEWLGLYVNKHPDDADRLMGIEEDILHCEQMLEIMRKEGDV